MSDQEDYVPSLQFLPGYADSAGCRTGEQEVLRRLENFRLAIWRDFLPFNHPRAKTECALFLVLK